ncbi:hypothetical protein EV363DRAFT_622021 [Boletus edulis]|nr:hypothetical protein EV363DRAFT_622021 [Boletus edulis]
MRRVSEKHRALGRSIAELDARGPSLINAPLPVNGGPVVDQLAAPVVGNGASGGAQPSSSPNPQPSPPGGGNGGGHGNGNGGGGNGNGGGHSNGGGSTPALPPSSTGDGGPAATPLSTAPSPVSPNPVPGQPSSSSRPNSGSNGSSMVSPSTTGGGGNFLGTTGGQTAAVNAASAPSMTSAALGASAPSAPPSDFPSNSVSNTAGIVAPSPTISAAAAVSSGKRFSGGAIAGIIIVGLFFLFPLILLVVRRHSIARRLELRRRWWFGRSALGHDSSLSSGSTRSSMRSNGEVPASRQSARSSFATNFDHGLMFRIDTPSRLSLDLVPDLPPTAEVRERNSILISTGGSVARRESMNSMLSNGSDPHAQYLTVSTGQDNLDPSTPMSVRPFSPSESFAFPKPPPSSTVDSFFISGTPGPASPQSSAATLVHPTTPSRAFMTDFPPAIPTSLHHQTSTPNLALSPFVAAPNPDPFADPVKPEFSVVEVIRRPFAPTLDDELAVQPGDRVHVFQVFDDGWAFVERLSSIASERRERGLIPVDCFRQVDQALPSFLAEKRVSYSDRKVATVL